MGKGGREAGRPGQEPDFWSPWDQQHQRKDSEVEDGHDALSARVGPACGVAQGSKMQGSGVQKRWDQQHGFGNYQHVDAPKM